mmetsp:Transcript_31517/g.74170  ORF Transcript_31517/g.74170 Transcript_31517/m.74170 type:complete len:278 (+) Transcript_31517:364-1197(+)
MQSTMCNCKILFSITLALGTASLSSSFAPSTFNVKDASLNGIRSKSVVGDVFMGNESDTEADALGYLSAKVKSYMSDVVAKRAIASCVAIGVLALGSSPVFADEYGRETEAPTLGTGESVMICTKRGPLGACLKTEIRTEENENDKSQKYFRQPTEVVKRKDSEARTAESSEGNVLIERLKKQSEENSEKNELLVYQRTLMNDASASFGPFDGQVLILNEDGKGFTLLANPQAMRLKKAGLIENKKFIRQPTQEELDAALEAETGGPNFLNRILGSS